MRGKKKDAFTIPLRVRAAGSVNLNATIGRTIRRSNLGPLWVASETSAQRPGPAVFCQSARQWIIGEADIVLQLVLTQCEPSQRTSRGSDLKRVKVFHFYAGLQINVA